MKCPFCNKDYLTQEEVMHCVIEHVRESQEQQAAQLQKIQLMLMAGQLTMASVATHTPARDVVERFGEIYQLLENVARKPDVVGEIEKWLKNQGGASDTPSS